jgi:hypothetical protein
MRILLRERTHKSTPTHTHTQQQQQEERGARMQHKQFNSICIRMYQC